MDLRVLRYFLKVVEEESISKAAEVLHLSQPTLSRQLMDLEEELHVKLFVRGNRKHRISLTDKGRILHRRANELISLASIAVNEINSDASSISGCISVGVTETPNLKFITKLMTAFRAKYPHVTFELHSTSYKEVREFLDKGILDFGVFLDSYDVPYFEHVKLPQSDNLGLIVRKDHPLFKKDYADHKDIYHYPLVLHKERMVSKTINGLSDVNFEDLDVVATFNQSNSATASVEAGLGIALGIDGVCNLEDNYLAFVPFKPEVRRNLNIAWKSVLARSQASELFIKELIKFCNC
ncbi:MAG: LysR family transcriptional regulator [Succinatimonas sp.]|nr:LysR family transcriptional regulator [Succinatimonas sp.]